MSGFEIFSIRLLTELQEANVFACESLKSPPKEVYGRGVESIRQYFKDLALGRSKVIPAVTVAVIGQTMAGKTSLIKTLQSEAKVRVLTNRGPGAANDPTTKVFNVESVTVEKVVLRFIDVGGQEVYHTTYQLTFRDSCIPLVVVSMEQYQKMRKDKDNALEAVRVLCFDWLSQIYVACPNLGPPKLVFTHLDLFTIEDFDSLAKEFLDTCQILKGTVIEEGRLITEDGGIKI